MDLLKFEQNLHKKVVKAIKSENIEVTKRCILDYIFLSYAYEDNGKKDDYNRVKDAINKLHMALALWGDEVGDNYVDKHLDLYDEDVIELLNNAREARAFFAARQCA